MRSDHRASSSDAADHLTIRRAGRPLVVLIALLPAVFACGGAFGQTQPKKSPGPAAAKAEDLLAADSFPKKWKDVSSDKKATLANTWNLDPKLKIPELTCTGKPPGYVRTLEKFANFDLTVEWLYPKDEDCNSGILVHCGDDKVWPASVQVQLHRPFAGSIFPMKGATTSSVVTVKSLKLDIGVWHTCRIRSVDGTITVWINGKQVGAVAGCKPLSGYLGLQSEGYPIRFRRFEITRLADPKKTKPKTSPAKKVPPPKTKTVATTADCSSHRNSPGTAPRPLEALPSEFVIWRPCDIVPKSRSAIKRNARRRSSSPRPPWSRCLVAAPCRRSLAPVDAARP